MSDTPRTDAAYSASVGAASYELLIEARDMERELAAANERIRRLEAAGNAMCHEMQFGEWREGTPRAQANAARRAWLAEMGGMA